MSEKTLVNLVKASDKAVKGRLQHVIAIVTPDGRIQLNGSANMVQAVNGNTALLNQLQDVMLGNVLGKEEAIVPSQTLDYPLLPCSPFSSSWQRQGSTRARSILSTMMSRAGYGRSGTKKQLGVGEPPYGWPQGISWEKYSGATRSGLTFNEVTEIIVSLLHAANIDPNEHILTSVVDPEDATDQNNFLDAAVDLNKDDDILDKEDNIIATGNGKDENADLEKVVITQVIDEVNIAESLAATPNNNVTMVQIEMKVLEDVLHHDTLDDNIEVVGFSNEEGGDVCVQDDLNDNVADAVEENTSGLEFKKRRHGYD